MLAASPALYDGDGRIQEERNHKDKRGGGAPDEGKGSSSGAAVVDQGEGDEGLLVARVRAWEDRLREQRAAIQLRLRHLSVSLSQSPSSERSAASAGNDDSSSDGNGTERVTDVLRLARSVAANAPPVAVAGITPPPSGPYSTLPKLDAQTALLRSRLDALRRTLQSSSSSSSSTSATSALATTTTTSSSSSPSSLAPGALSAPSSFAVASPSVVESLRASMAMRTVTSPPPFAACLQATSPSGPSLCSPARPTSTAAAGGGGVSSLLRSPASSSSPSSSSSLPPTPSSYSASPALASSHNSSASVDVTPPPPMRPRFLLKADASGPAAHSFDGPAHSLPTSGGGGKPASRALPSSSSVSDTPTTASSLSPATAKAGSGGNHQLMPLPSTPTTVTTAPSSSREAARAVRTANRRSLPAQLDLRPALRRQEAEATATPSERREQRPVPRRAAPAPAADKTMTTRTTQAKAHVTRERGSSPGGKQANAPMDTERSNRSPAPRGTTTEGTASLRASTRTLEGDESAGGTGTSGGGGGGSPLQEDNPMSHVLREREERRRFVEEEEDECDLVRDLLVRPEWQAALWHPDSPAAAPEGADRAAAAAARPPLRRVLSLGSLSPSSPGGAAAEAASFCSYRPTKGDAVDVELARVIREMGFCKTLLDIPRNFQRIGAGQYQFGTKKIRIEVQGGNRLMVRMGGGGTSFVAFVDKYGASECRKVVPPS